MGFASAIFGIAAGVRCFAAEPAKRRGRPWNGALAAYGEGLLTAFFATLAISTIEHRDMPRAVVLPMRALVVWFRSILSIVGIATDPHDRPRAPSPGCGQRGDN